MRVKRYVAPDIEEAMVRIKSELGSDAIILHTRHFKEGGFLGLFKKNYVEVTAATETTNVSVKDKIPASKTITEMAPPSVGITPPFRKKDLLYEKNVGPEPGEPEEQLPRSISYDLTAMKDMMSDMSLLIESSNQQHRFPKLGQQLYNRLLKQEVDEKIASRIIRATMHQLTAQPQLPHGQAAGVLYDNLLKPVRNKCKPVVFSKSRRRMPKVFAIVGPTGVGKTTTIAKMAAMYALADNRKIAFVTVDTYRIAAADQLKTIGEIMNVPVHVVYSLNQLQDCLMEMADKEIIFVDTAGRSHKNNEQVEELKRYLEIANPDEIFMALPCTGKCPDLMDILGVYKELNITRLIFTKLDETSTYGSIYNIACRSKYPLAYFTTGQNIPDDIEIADPALLIRLIMKEQ